MELEREKLLDHLEVIILKLQERADDIAELQHRNNKAAGSRVVKNLMESKHMITEYIDNIKLLRKTF